MHKSPRKGLAEAVLLMSIFSQNSNFISLILFCSFNCSDPLNLVAVMRKIKQVGFDSFELKNFYLWLSSCLQLR